MLNLEHILEGALDKDERNQGSKHLLGESVRDRRILRNSQRKREKPGDVADEGTGVKGHQQKEDDRHPDSNPEAQGQIVPIIGLTQLKEDFLKDIDRAR